MKRAIQMGVHTATASTANATANQRSSPARGGELLTRGAPRSLVAHLVQAPLAVPGDQRRAAGVVGPEERVVHPLAPGHDVIVVDAVLLEDEGVGVLPHGRGQPGARLSRKWKTGIERP